MIYDMKKVLGITDQDVATMKELAKGIPNPTPQKPYDDRVNAIMGEHREAINRRQEALENAAGFGKGQL